MIVQKPGGILGTYDSGGQVLVLNNEIARRAANVLNEWNRSGRVGRLVDAIDFKYRHLSSQTRLAILKKCESWSI